MAKAPSQLSSLLEPIQPELKCVESLLDEILAKLKEPLDSMLRCVLVGGKQVRPALVIIIGQMFAGPAVAFHKLAAAVQILHTATLIHDDLVDEAPLRRGRETLHTMWPAAATVLAGDYLLGQATSLIAELKHPRIFKVFGDILCIMCAGEIERMVVTDETSGPREDYYRNIEAKTASLFAASAEMASVLAGATERQTTALYRFGRELGLAFQMVDDVLDIVGDEAGMGKPAGSDLRQGLLTLPVLYYLEKAEDHTPIEVVLTGQRDKDAVRKAMEAIRSSGAIEASLAEARVHAKRSQEALATLPDSASREMLHALAEFVVERRR